MHQPVSGSAHILIVDDQKHNVLLLERILRRGGYHNVQSTTNPAQVGELCATLAPDLILLDIHMPHIDGFAILAELRARYPPPSYVPVLALTADSTRETRERALLAGARDFLNKPFDSTEVLLRIGNLLETRQYYLQLERQNAALEERVLARTRQLEMAQYEILTRLALAAEFRDDATGKHAQRVGRISALLAEALALPTEQTQLVRRAAPLHDVGKIGIPDRLLLKPGKLTPAEFALMQAHTLIGANLLAGSEFPLLRVAEDIARSHHERWDGTGYPESLAGDNIPIVGRIAAVADVFDALTHDRPYKRAWATADAVSEIERQAGRQFDAAVVAAFDRALPEISSVATGASPTTVLLCTETHDFHA
jgi:putative two-component system response regulator